MEFYRHLHAETDASIAIHTSIRTYLFISHTYLFDRWETCVNLRGAKFILSSALPPSDARGGLSLLSTPFAIDVSSPISSHVCAMHVSMGLLWVFARACLPLLFLIATDEIIGPSEPREFCVSSL